MMTKEDIARSLGAMLTLSALASMVFTLSTMPEHPVFAALHYYITFLMLPFAFMGFSTLTTQRFPKFSETAFTASVFVIVAFLVLGVVSVSNDIIVMLILGSIAGGLVVCMIKLKPPVTHIICSSFGLIVSVYCLLLFTNF